MTDETREVARRAVATLDGMLDAIEQELGADLLCGMLAGALALRLRRGNVPREHQVLLFESAMDTAAARPVEVLQ